MTRIGPKGQMVIEKELREQLGIGPGWQAVQAIRGNELVVRFEPPLHHRSLGGIFRNYAMGSSPPTDDQMDEAVGEAIAADWREKETAGDFDA
jgi:bifunctional DNA-binding transcriptional regulator/antitoxin component of YhaV-PrlF toxin-antitoxin module